MSDIYLRSGGGHLRSGGQGSCGRDVINDVNIVITLVRIIVVGIPGVVGGVGVVVVAAAGGNTARLTSSLVFIVPVVVIIPTTFYIKKCPCCIQYNGNPIRSQLCLGFCFRIVLRVTNFDHTCKKNDPGSEKRIRARQEPYQA